MPAARLFLATRPPSYFDIARRLLYRASFEGFDSEVFVRLLRVVNAIRGTRYQDPIGTVLDPQTIELPWLSEDKDGGLDVASDQDPVLVLGNLVVPHDSFTAAVRGQPVHDLPRLRGLNTVVERAMSVSRARPSAGKQGPPTLLVLPELSVPRRWFRFVAHYVVRHATVPVVTMRPR